MAAILFTAVLLIFAKRTKGQLDVGFASSHSCNETCQQLVTTGASWERTQHVVPNDPFYVGPFTHNSSTAAGEVLRLEPVTDLTNYSVPSALSMSRLIYTTEDYNGTIIPASAYVLWPHTPYVPTGQTYTGDVKFQTVAWAHGTSGAHSNCAPSNYQNLQYNFMIPFEVAMQGFAVVAPDYAGLGVAEDFEGNTIHHPWAFGPAQANDLAFAVEAARKAFPSLLSDDFVVLGHSQGGGTAWAFAQRQADSAKAVAGYLGTATLAPATDVLAQTVAAFANPTDPAYAVTLFGGIQQLLISSITAVFPAFNFTGLTDVGYNLWQVVQQVGGCLPTQSLLITYAGLVAKPGWFNNTIAQEYFSVSRNGGKAFKGPLLVIASEADSTLPYHFIDTAVNNTCALMKSTASLKQESLEFKTVQGLDHFPLIQGSHSAWIEWIKARFEHQDVGIEAGCKSETIVSFRVNATKPGTAPNWLLTATTPLNQWQGSL